MTFLHPWAIACGLAAVALPLVIHWLTRPRPVRLPLSTVRFVRQAVQQRRARRRLRDAIVLALRVLAVLLLAGAIARPLLGEQPLVTPTEAGDAARVVVLDVSHSMAATANGIQLFERARPVAAGHLPDQPGLQANLILAGASARAVFDRLSTNYGALREELAKAGVRPERLQAQAALNLAGELLARAGDPGRRRELVVVSDFQRSNWANVDFSALPQDTRIQLESVAPAEALVNLAVLRVGSQGRIEEGREARLEVEVGNFSPTPRQVQVQLALGDATYRLEGLCPPWNRATLAAEVPLRGLGWLAGEARLLDVQDALAGDNVRPFMLEVRPAPTYALITRQPADVRPSSSYYLERALVPVAAGAGRSEGRVLRMDPAHVDREALAAAEVLVLDHPGKLPAETLQFLATALRRGRGVFYVAAEPTDATNLKLLAEAAGSELQMPVEFAPPPAGQRRRDLFLSEVRHDQPPFSVFGDGLASLTGTLRFAGGLTSRRLEGALTDDVLASYGDRSACLVVSACGGGTLAVLNADLTASNLPGSPAFVPLVGELMGRLLGRQRVAEALACGEPLAVSLPAAAGPAAGLRVLGPGGAADDASPFVDESGGVLWRQPAAGVPGVYQVKRDGTTVFAVAAAVPADESDLRPLDPAVFGQRLAGGRAIHYRAAAGGEEGRDDVWVWLAVACVACLLGEVVALKSFRT
jgi:hypothetical protein